MISRIRWIPLLGILFSLLVGIFSLTYWMSSKTVMDRFFEDFLKSFPGYSVETVVSSQGYDSIVLRKDQTVFELKSVVKQEGSSNSLSFSSGSYVFSGGTFYFSEGFLSDITIEKSSLKINRLFVKSVQFLSKDNKVAGEIYGLEFSDSTDFYPKIFSFSKGRFLTSDRNFEISFAKGGGAFASMFSPEFLPCQDCSFFEKTLKNISDISVVNGSMILPYGNFSFEEISSVINTRDFGGPVSGSFRIWKSGIQSSQSESFGNSVLHSLAETSVPFSVSGSFQRNGSLLGLKDVSLEGFSYGSFLSNFVYDFNESRLKGLSFVYEDKGFLPRYLRFLSDQKKLSLSDYKVFLVDDIYSIPSLQRPVKESLRLFLDRFGKITFEMKSSEGVPIDNWKMVFTNNPSFVNWETRWSLN